MLIGSVATIDISRLKHQPYAVQIPTLNVRSELVKKTTYMDQASVSVEGEQ